MALNRKIRSEAEPYSGFVQIDEYLEVFKRLSIPTASDDLLEADGILPFKLIYNTTKRKLRIYDGTVWSDASEIDLSGYYTKTEIDLLFGTVNTELVRIGNLVLEANQLTSEIYLKDNDGNILSTLSVGFLNNEGSVFEYNSTTNTLDLKNQQNELLASVPISSFISNIASQISFNNTVPYTLQLTDSSNVVLSSINITINNISGLQSTLDSKEPAFLILPTTKGGTGIDYINENSFYIGGATNNLIEKTPAEILSLINAQETLIIGDGLSKFGNLLKIISASSERLIINTNNIDLAQTAVSAGTYTKVTVDNYGRVVSASQVTPVDISIILQSLSDLSANGIICKIDATNTTTRVIQGTTGRITLSNGNGISGNPTIDLSPTSVVAGSYNGFVVDDYGRITSASVLTKSSLGLSNVDNVSDINKPVSTLTQTAINDAIVTLINGAPSDANTLKLLNDKILAINSIIGGVTADSNTIVDTVTELLNIFQTYPEGMDILTLITDKVDKTSIINNLSQVSSGTVLDARQGKILNDLITSLTTSVSNATNRANHTGTQLASTISDFDSHVLSIIPTYTLSSLGGASVTRLINGYDLSADITLTTNNIADSNNKRYQTENQKTFNDATASIQTQLNVLYTKNGSFLGIAYYYNNY